MATLTPFYTIPSYVILVLFLYDLQEAPFSCLQPPRVGENLVGIGQCFSLQPNTFLLNQAAAFTFAID